MICLVAALASGAEPRAAAPVASPVEAEASLALFQVPGGIEIELAACEPQVIDPVAIRFDEHGRLWVVEMRDYPFGAGDGRGPHSRIRLLEDQDRDGRFETSQVFCDGLDFATGVQPWRGGVIVTMSGKLAFMRDTDGDRRADEIRTWYTGFTEENPQLRANHPRFALDNRIYVANGLRDGEIRSALDPAHKPVSLRGRDFCFDPLSGRFEAVSGHGQFGLSFDDFGNRFQCSNRNPLVHVVLAERYLARNPYLAVPAVTCDVAAAGEASRVFPISQAWTTSILHAGQFTAACGVTIYRGDLLSDCYGHAFTCEPTGNLVHCERLRPHGATFTSRPAYQGVEFLASPDTWLRPVNLEVGPDGALYLVDMYRAVIEHPEFMPEELQQRPDLRLGDDRGRIYRLVPAGRPRSRPAAPLADASSDELVRALEHPNAWWRETAARLIYQRQDRGMRATLEELARRSLDPRSRLHAMWALEGLGLVSDKLLAEALSDGHPRVREQAVLLCEPRLSASDSLRQAVIALAGDGDARVRFQVALSIGEAPGPDLVEPLARIALARPDDAWTRHAVASASPELSGALLAAVLRHVTSANTIPADGQVSLLAELARVGGARGDAAGITVLLADLGADGDGVILPARLAVLHGLAQGLSGRGATLEELLAREPANRKAWSAALDLFRQAAVVAGSDKADIALRLQACRLLAHAPLESAGPLLADLARHPRPELRLEALGSLAAHTGGDVPGLLLALLGEQAPAGRQVVLEALVSRAAWAALLLDEVAAGRLTAAELGALCSARLLEHPDEHVRSRARELLADSRPAERNDVLARYRPALELPSDARRGKETFRNHCSTCHKIGDVGTDLAPSIADSRTKTPAQLLVDILDPNRAIDNNYISYTVVTHDGRALAGIVTAETAGSVTLVQPDGKPISLLRGDIDEMRTNGISLMPEGLERAITEQQMADLISFIKNWRYLAKDEG